MGINTSSSDLKYGLHADRTILCALHVCPSQASVTCWQKSNKSYVKYRAFGIGERTDAPIWKWSFITFIVHTHHFEKLTSVKLFSSRKWRNEVTIFVWKSFHFRKNCWSAIFSRCTPSKLFIEKVLKLSSLRTIFVSFDVVALGYPQC